MELFRNIAPYFLPVFAITYFLTELYRTFSLRGSGDKKSDKDKSSERVLWITIMLTLSVSGFANVIPGTHINGMFPWLSMIALVLMASGYIIRLVAIRQLKQFFTVNVQIQSGHQLIQNGLYGFVRHPSYTGALVMFFAISLCYYNWLSIIAIMVPITMAFLYRIKVEEDALSSAFGDGYKEYSSRVKRLIPFVY